MNVTSASAEARELRDDLVAIIRLFGEAFVRLPRGGARLADVLSHLTSIAWGSIPIVTVSTAFAGLVITNEMAWHMDKALHSVSMIPGFTGQFILRELGIAIPALLVVSKVGAAITAEVGSMKVTEQIDALKLLGIDPVTYLVCPRWIACILACVSLVLIASAVTLSGAIFVAVNRYGFSVLEYLQAFEHFVTLSDLACAVTKGAAFGAVIPIISCSYGFRCRGGAEGVGTATTQSVVTSTLSIIVIDFVLTYVFSHFL